MLTEGMVPTTHILPITILIVAMQGLAQARPLSVPRVTLLSSSIIACEGAGDNQSKSRHGTSDQSATTPCNLRVPDTTPQPSTKDEATTPTNESLAYTPLSVRCKFRLFLTSTYSPYTFASAAFQATEAQATGQWPQYGGGMQGWGKRFGAALANTESRRFIQGFALSTILHQDPRYFPSRKRKLISRAWYSATRVVVTKNDSGNSTFNTSEFLGALFTSALQNTYYPTQDRNVEETMNRFSGALSSDAIGNLLREFTPEMKRLFLRHAPKEVRRIEKKLPIPPEDKP
jgi:hypothetical protein